MVGAVGGGNMDTTLSSGPLGDQPTQSDWLCRNCGSFSSPISTHCESCGFVKGYDPAEQPAVQQATMPALFIPRDELPGRVMFYMSLIQTVAVVAIAVLLIPLLLRLAENWPFQSPYERDALQLASRLMSLSASIEIGMTKAEYDSQLAPLLGENARFKGMYGERPERQRDSFQKLVQAAEFYGFAGQAWNTKLLEERGSSSTAATAYSAQADQSVRDYWQRAKASATGALTDLH
jgi:hypothetical protein